MVTWIRSFSIAFALIDEGVCLFLEPSTLNQAVSKYSWSTCIRSLLMNECNGMSIQVLDWVILRVRKPFRKRDQ